MVKMVMWYHCILFYIVHKYVSVLGVRGVKPFSRFTCCHQEMWSFTKKNMFVFLPLEFILREGFSLRRWQWLCIFLPLSRGINFHCCNIVILHHLLSSFFSYRGILRNVTSQLECLTSFCNATLHFAEIEN